MTRKALFILVTLVVIFSCNKPEEVPPAEGNCQPKYTADIKIIADSKCAISGCHDGNGSLPDLTNYSALKSRADNGRLQSHVIEKKIMPPASAEKLTEAELETFKCWLENGAPES